MKKTVNIIILAAGGAAALLLLGAAIIMRGTVQPHPYTAASWLAALLAFGVCAVMLAQYFIHGRFLHLCLGATYLSLGIISAWEALSLPTEIVRSIGKESNFTLWQGAWITLAIMLIYCMIANFRTNPRRSVQVGITVIAASVLWSAIVILLSFKIPAITAILTTGKSGVIIQVSCAAVFALAFISYTRPFLHRGNAVLAWMGYGMLFAVFSQTAIAFESGKLFGPLFGFANLMKVFSLLLPLAGMFAEHTRLQLRFQGQASDLSNLMQLQNSVNAITNPDDLYQRIVKLASSSFPADAVCLMPFDRERSMLHVVAQIGCDDEIAKRLMFRPVEGPVGGSFSDKEMVIVDDIHGDPVLSQKLDGTGNIQSAIFTPLIVRDASLGVLALFFAGNSVESMGKEQIRLLEAFAAQAAIAVERVQLHGRMISTTKTTDDYARELEIVWDIGQSIGQTLELHELIDILAEKLRSAVGAKTCSVLIYDADSVGLKIMGHRKLTRYNSVSEHVDECDVIAASVAQYGELIMMNDVPNSCHCKYPELALDDTGVHHLLCVPMSLRGFKGAISVFRQNAEPFGDREKRLLTRLAPVVAAGIRNAELYEREKKIADSLQQSFLPNIEQELPDMQISCSYQAALDDSQVGGDFYDVIQFDEDRYGIVIGDVAGKGLDAAIYTAMTRYMIQAYSADDPDPVHVISKLNAALCRYTPVSKFITLVYGIIDTQADSFTYVNAGHELPLLFTSKEKVLSTLQSTGPAAGALLEAEYTSNTIPFESEDVLVLYTDGATDARSNGKFLELEGLKAIVSKHIHKSAHDLPASILSGINSYVDGRPSDDIAILVVKARKPGSLF